MTSSLPTIATTSTRVDDDTAARVALACAGVSGEPSVHVGIHALGGAAQFVAAVHAGNDQALALSNLVRQRIRAFAIGSRVARVLEGTAAHGFGILTPECELWPTQLESLRGIAPTVLWVDGDPGILLNPSVALTGTASPTGYGIHMGIELSTGLAQRGWVIAAGAGSGIDQLALRGADAMRGRGITVAAASLDKPRNRVTKGVAVSELPPGGQLTVRAQRRAKYLLAALTVKTIVVEAGLSSGALRTAEAAHAMDRPVGVVPGPITSPFSAGCHRLAQQHYVSLVTSIKDADRLR
ncbi:MAG: DNA-processing protein DprA [Salinibacterium sp.]|nr:DNA-processing protein DprA [Salinibacterium sp.]